MLGNPTGDQIFGTIMCTCILWAGALISYTVVYRNSPPEYWWSETRKAELEHERRMKREHFRNCCACRDGRARTCRRKLAKSTRYVAMGEWNSWERLK